MFFLIQNFYTTSGLNSKLDKKLKKSIVETFPQLKYCPKRIEILLK